MHKQNSHDEAISAASDGFASGSEEDLRIALNIIDKLFDEYVDYRTSKELNKLRENVFDELTKVLVLTMLRENINKMGSKAVDIVHKSQEISKISKMKMETSHQEGEALRPHNANPRGRSGPRVHFRRRD